MGGIAGAIGLNVLGGAVSGIVGSAVEKLMDSFGLDEISSAVSNFVTQAVGEGLKMGVGMLPIPQFLKEAIFDVIDSAVDSVQNEVDSECQCQVNDAMGSKGDDLKKLGQSLVENCIKENTDESKEAGGKGDNWLTLLAKSLGKIQGEHLQKMVELQDEMSGLTGKDDAGKMAEVQAEFQAQSQMFKLSSEATSTALKSIGEGLSSLARKQ